jgi:dCMP deaminase
MGRISWDQYFMELMESISKRATCDRGRSGCLIVRGHQIVCTGYVGSPSGLPHCDDVGHLMKEVIDEDGTARSHCVRTIHAEQNAICQAAKYGTPLEGTVLYCKMEPCRVCAMLIISSGIKKVVAQKKYHAAHDSREMFKAAGVELVVIHNQIEQYQKQ